MSRLNDERSWREDDEIGSDGIGIDAGWTITVNRCFFVFCEKCFSVSVNTLFVGIQFWLEVCFKLNLWAICAF